MTLEQGGRSNDRKTVLLTGGTGYLAGLILAKLLVEEHVSFVVLVRRAIELDELLPPIDAEIRLGGHPFRSDYRERLRLVTLPDWRRLSDLDGMVRDLGVDEVIHAAGCLDYFNAVELQQVNVEFTRALVAWAATWGCRRFIYISSAFSSGYRDGAIPEALHEGSQFSDPTDYTRSKRAAELAVAASGVPYLILRPSVVIGDSRDGHYSGKRYGLYQLWIGMERLLFDQWRPVVHVVGPRVVQQFLHQDAFQDIFLGAYRHLPPNSVLHAAPQQGPTMRDLWEMWLPETLRPDQTVFYERVEDVPLRALDRRQRSLLGLASTNLEIASRPWAFETRGLEALRRRGIHIAETTVESVHRCQRLFIEESKTIQAYISNHWRQAEQAASVVPA
jgi:nucleoside-diphosphate-sugar epimerase